MKILYVIQTCDNYFHTRCESSTNTWLKKINSVSDYVFLSANPVGEKVVGYRTRDDYFSLPDKWINFITNYDLKKFDWVFAVDDDLFCFPERLEKFIVENNFNPNELISIGNKNCFFGELNDDIFCGGAGILISKTAIQKIKEFVSSTSEPIKHLCGDCNFHYWFEKLQIPTFNACPGNTTNGNFISVYYKENHEIVSNLAQCITLHYCKNEDKYELYKQFYE